MINDTDLCYGRGGGGGVGGGVKRNTFYYFISKSYREKNTGVSNMNNISN